MTTDAFASIVAPTPGSDAERADLLVVRARFRGDLKRLFGPETPEIEWPDGATDYRFRTLIPRPMVDAALARAVAGITYGNFKNSVRENWRHDDLLRVWGILKGAQDREERIEQRGRRPAWQEQAQLFRDTTLPAAHKPRKRAPRKPKAKTDAPPF